MKINYLLKTLYDAECLKFFYKENWTTRKENIKKNSRPDRKRNL